MRFRYLFVRVGIENGLRAVKHGRSNQMAQPTNEARVAPQTGQSGRQDLNLRPPAPKARGAASDTNDLRGGGCAEDALRYLIDPQSRRRRGYMTRISWVGASVPRATSKPGHTRGCIVGAGPARRVSFNTKLGRSLKNCHPGSRPGLSRRQLPAGRSEMATDVLNNWRLSAAISFATVAQPGEHAAYNRAVAGSSPAGGILRPERRLRILAGARSAVFRRAAA